MKVDTVPVEALERIPDPTPGPDMQVADLLDGQRAATFGLAKYAAVLAHLPPAVADALAAEYRHACALSPDEAERYHPSVAALARTCGMDWHTLNSYIAKAIAASRLAERGPNPPPGRGTVGRNSLFPPLQGPGFPGSLLPAPTTLRSLPLGVPTPPPAQHTL